MPVIFVHGVSVRQVAYDEVVAKVRLALRHRIPESQAGINSYFWGGSGVALRWGGASIPNMPPGEQIALRTQVEEQVPLPDLRAILLMYPLGELDALRQRTPDQGGITTGFNPTFQKAQDRNVELNAKLNELSEALKQHLAALPELAPDFLRQTVESVLGAAVKTREDIPIPTLIPIIAKALTASVYRRIVPPGEALNVADNWERLHAPILKATEQAFKSQLTFIGEAARNTGLSLATFALRHGLRSQVMPPVVRFLGDCFVYLANRETYLEGLHATVVEATNMEKKELGGPSPLWLVGHSLGGIIAFDYCTRHPEVDVDRLATVGSQVGLMAEGDLLWQSVPKPAAGAQRAAPANVAHWMSVYDENDMLSFRAAPVFEGVDEEMIESGSPFPDSHGAYWDNEKVYDKIFGPRIPG